eukprot:6239162-Prymnesium_polylepis.1
MVWRKSRAPRTSLPSLCFMRATGLAGFGATAGYRKAMARATAVPFVWSLHFGFSPAPNVRPRR